MQIRPDPRGWDVRRRRVLPLHQSAFAAWSTLHKPSSNQVDAPGCIIRQGGGERLCVATSTVSKPWSVCVKKEVDPGPAWAFSVPAAGSALHQLS